MRFNKPLRVSLICLTALLCNACGTTPPHPTLNEQCTEPRPEVCTMDYQPVCALKADKTKKTYSNACSACSSTSVSSYSLGECIP